MKGKPTTTEQFLRLKRAPGLTREASWRPGGEEGLSTAKSAGLLAAGQASARSDKTPSGGNI